MHHTISNRYNYPSDDLYSLMFDQDHNWTAKVCFATYLTPVYMTVWKTSKSYTLDVALVTSVFQYFTSVSWQTYIQYFSNASPLRKDSDESGIQIQMKADSDESGAPPKRIIISVIWAYKTSSSTRCPRRSQTFLTVDRFNLGLQKKLASCQLASQAGS